MVTLSIFIATYNRRKILKRKLEGILAVQSQDFDVWVLDDCSDDGTDDMVKEITDSRIHYIRNEERMGIKVDGAMPNWYRLLEACDGRFAFHLNDRDIFYTEKLIGLIDFLKKHWECTAGVCDSFTGEKMYATPEEALMAIPYKAYHPTGIIFRMDLYKDIPERASFFEKEISYIHPHDLVLGKLSEKGKMFHYDKMFELADKESFANNKSFYYKKGNEVTAWFAPDERLKEFSMFIRHLNSLNFKKSIKREKVFKIAKTYLYYCTFNYKYYVTDPGQTKHYGIEKQEFGLVRMFICAGSFIEKSAEILKDSKYLENTASYKMRLRMYFCAVCLAKPIWDLYKKGARRKW